MRGFRRVHIWLVAAPLAAFALACEGQAERIFYDDLDAADGTAPVDATQGGGDGTGDGATPDSSDASDADAGTEAFEASDGSVDGASDGASDAGGDAGDGVADAAIEAEAGCGPVDTVQNCGRCGSACDSLHSQDAGCNGGSCTYSGCAAGYADCDSSAPNTNGCETRLDGVSNCTGCGIACDTTNSVGTGCNGATCTYSGCKAGYGDCNASPPNSNGCETPIDTTSNCTQCGVACDTIHSQGAACAATGCTYAGCNAGYADCDASTPNANGCETPTTTAANCGGCGIACGSQHATGSSCVGAACAYTCATGWTNCDTKAPNVNGCECNTPTCCAGDGGVSGCQTTHNTGFPNLSYYDCNPIATATESQAKLLTQAIEACTAYTGSVSQCATGLTCSGTPRVGPYVCDGMGGASCSTCWSYGGTDVLMTENCSCPPNVTVIGSWN